MSNAIVKSEGDRSLKLLLVDEDPIFQLGLRTALESCGNFSVVVVANPSQTLNLVATEQPQLVILELVLSDYSGWQLCQQLQTTYPSLPIFLLTATLDYQQLLAAQKADISGYAPKGIAIDQLVTALYAVASGRKSWQPFEPDNKYALPPVPTSKKWLSQVRQSGLEQIGRDVTRLNHQIAQSQLSSFDRLFLSGRRRELTAARWLIEQLLPVEVVVVPQQPQQEQAQEPSQDTQAEFPLVSKTISLTKSLDNISDKIDSGLINATDLILEIDFLTPQKQQELLNLAFKKWQQIIDEIKVAKVRENDLIARMPLIVRNIWQNSTIDFFTDNHPRTFDLSEYKIIDVLLEESFLVQEVILDKIPLVNELVSYLIFEKELVVGQVKYAYQSPEGIFMMQAITENLIIQIANGVAQVILNHLDEFNFMRQALYKDKFKSSRELAEFRNHLSWQFIKNKYWYEPRFIFEDTYRLFHLENGFIKTINLAKINRRQELKQLTGIRYAVTVSLEIRDAIAPIFRSLVAFVGEGLVYVLTQVIGRGIGLVGKGVIQGIGSSLSDSKYKKNSGQEK